jgi:hypothetical protein
MLFRCTVYQSCRHATKVKDGRKGHLLAGRFPASFFPEIMARGKSQLVNRSKEVDGTYYVFAMLEYFCGDGASVQCAFNSHSGPLVAFVTSLTCSRPLQQSIELTQLR